MTAGDLLSKLSQRMRGPAHSPTLLYAILSHTQRLINLHHGLVKQNVAVTTTPEQVFYSLTSTGLNRVDGVQIGGRDLKPSNLARLGYLSRSWGRARGATLRLWGKVGRTLWFLYPASEAPASVTVVGTKLLADVTAEGSGTTLELPDQYLTAVADLAEAVLLVKEKRTEYLPPLMARLSAQLGVPNGESNNPVPRR